MAEANEIMLQNVSQVPQGKSPAKTEHDAAKGLKKITVRSHTKVIYYLPTILAAMVCGFQVPAHGGGMWTNIFLSMFFLNTVVVLFDFNSLRTLFLTLVVALLGLGLWHFGMVPFISTSLAKVQMKMNSQAFYSFALFFGMLIIGDFVWSHLNRWEFSANEIKHIQAFAGHTANFPGRGLRFQVRTVDVFERLLLGAGTVLLIVGKKKIKLQNVILAHRKVHELEKFIRSTGVFSDDEDVFEEDDDDEED